MTSIIFVGGFGGSSDYSKPMCIELQKITQKIVYNFNLQHGCTLEEECKYILSNINININKSQPVIVIGFSTGCLIAMELTKYVNIKTVVLCNPAEVVTRLNYPCMESLLDNSPKTRNISTFLPIWQPQRTNRFSIILYKTLWKYIDQIWWLGKYFLGADKMSRIYYYLVARHVNEPRADELSKLLFQKNMKELRKTVTECLVKPSLIEKIRNFQGKIHIVQGFNDTLYIPYGNLLFYNNKNVLLHRTNGDHHMIYHHPKITAERIASIIPK